MLKRTVVVAALAGLPMLATAQPAAPALPSLSTPDGLQAHLEEIIKLQRQQLQASQQASVPMPGDSRACIYSNQVYSEGAELSSTENVPLICKREYGPVGAPPTPPRLAWARR